MSSVLVRGGRVVTSSRGADDGPAEQLAALVRAHVHYHARNPQLAQVIDTQFSDKALARFALYLGQQSHVAKASGLSEELLKAINEAMGGWPPREGGIDEAATLVPDDVVDALTVSGGAEECRAAAQRYATRDSVYPVILPLTDNYEEIAEAFAPN